VGPFSYAGYMSLSLCTSDRKKVLASWALLRPLRDLEDSRRSGCIFIQLLPVEGNGRNIEKRSLTAWKAAREEGDKSYQYKLSKFVSI